MIPVVLKGEKIIFRAWVLAYYNNQWMLLDTYMNRILYDKEEICRWYYTSFIEDLIVIYNDEYKPWAGMPSGVYFNDGKYYLTNGIIYGAFRRTDMEANLMLV